MRTTRWLMLTAMAGLTACGRDASDTATAAAIPAPVPAAIAVAPSQLGLCAACHGRNGIAIAANTPNLAGRPSTELLAAMQAYLDGRRDYTPMRAMLGPIGPEDRRRLADWFAAQPAPAEAAPGRGGASP